jgi:hypothetical protein
MPYTLNLEIPYTLDLEGALVRKRVATSLEWSC